MSFCHEILKLGVLKFLKLGLLALWRAITSCENIWLKLGLKKSCSPHWQLSNNMWHATYKHVFQGNFQLLMVGNQIGTLTLSPYFGHNLWFKCSNGSCEPILDIYVSKAFQRYKEIFNPMSFGLLNTSLNIWNSIGISKGKNKRENVQKNTKHKNEWVPKEA